MHQDYVENKTEALALKIGLKGMLSSFKSLFTAAVNNHSFTETQNASFLLSQIRGNQIYFAKEPWHGPYAENFPAKEMLLRAQNQKDQVALFDGLHAIKNMGYTVDIDALIIACELESALLNNDLPVTLNISVESALSNEFWDEIEPYMLRASKKPGTIVFELLETDNIKFIKSLSPKDLDVLAQQKKKWGFHLAIDDYGSVKNDHIRLKKLAPLTDYVKLDGKVYQEEKGNDPGGYVKKTISKIHETLPGAAIVVEWVGSHKDSQEIFNNNNNHVVFIQSRSIQTLDTQKFWKSSRVGAACIIPNLSYS